MLQLLFDKVVDVFVVQVVQDIPVVTQRLIPMVLVTMEIPQLLFAWCAGRASSTGAVVEETAVLQQLHLVEKFAAFSDLGEFGHCS